MFNNERIIGNYTKKDLKEVSHISLTIPVTNKVLANLMHVKNNTTITLNKSSLEPEEEKYYQDVIKVINRLKEIDKTFTIVIKVTNRQLLKESNIIRLLPINVNLKIDNDDHIYNLSEYLKEEKKLENMVLKIRTANLSPLEKYLAVYDIVKKYKPYNENDKNPNESRKLKHILNDNNPYIVCAGFTKLLTELLNRVGIPSKYISVMIDTSYEKGMTVEERLVSYEKHARNLVKIDDNKYNIHGIYLADSTWDNHRNYDLFINCLLTFDRKKEAKRLEKLDDIDLLMDFHSMEEFQAKIKYYFKKYINHPGINNETEEELRKKTYKDLYLKIIDILSSLDKKKYLDLYSRYDSLLNFNLSEVTSSSLETILSNFLYEYSKYIIPLSNQRIDLNTIFRAMTVVKGEVDWMDTEEIKKWLAKAMKDNLEEAEKEFPYVYDESFKEAYVEKKK